MSSDEEVPVIIEKSIQVLNVAVIKDERCGHQRFSWSSFGCVVTRIFEIFFNKFNLIINNKGSE